MLAADESTRAAAEVLTDGCVALRDGDMDAIWPVSRVGLSVTIVGVLP